MELEFFKCKHCGQIVKKVVDKETPLICCGEEMQKLIPNTVDAAKEKHVPVLELGLNKAIVKVGSIDHPMVDVHYIEWIIIATNQGSYKYNLLPGQAPIATFNLRDGETVEHVYCYCNLHGLWAI